MKNAFLSCVLLLLTATAFTDPLRTITGTVTDDAGNPVIAYIHVKGISQGVTSGRDGSFRLEVKDEKAVLVITAPGYEQKEVKTAGASNLNIRLQSARKALEEVIVMGYGVRDKKYMLMDNTLMSSQPASKTDVTRRVFGASAPVPMGNYPAMSYHQDREGYDAIAENPFLATADNPLSTFSIDVDAASYSNVRRIIMDGHLPTPGAVRIEEMMNYFSYDYKAPVNGDPFSVHTELTSCPWNPHHQLMLIGLQGKRIDTKELPASNLTFLIDVSGSMMMPDKLPLVKASLQLLTDQLREKDKVSIVVYAGNAGLVLPPTNGAHKLQIKEAIGRLEAGGSTAGGAGIELAYQVARENFEKNGNNRVILCTDGDFNVGESSDDALEKLIENERKYGVYLTVLGYGKGNYQDAKMQKLADKGNGNHAYIDGISEARKVLITEFGGTLFTIAKDVKMQLEFNPAKVKGYRLIGYENRVMAKEDFKNDAKDAGDLGSGHTVTALYELVPPGEEMSTTAPDPLRYQSALTPTLTDQQKKNELVFIQFRYKQPGSDNSTQLSVPVSAKPISLENASNNLRFAASVASFGMILRNSPHKGSSSYNLVHAMASKALGEDREGYRKEFIELVERAGKLSAGDDIVKW